MKKFLVTLLLSALFFVACGGGSSDSEKKEVIEEKSQTVTAKDGGEIEIAGGEAKIRIPAGALDRDLDISVKLYKTNGFKNKNALASNVVEFGPSGTVFKKPVIITINAGKAVKGKTVAAAVLKSDGTWSYSKKGAYAILEGFEATGDPIMISATGDPIMLNATGDPIMQSATGDPIMMSATGDPIMLMGTGDPIMTNATGDPIMTTATGDPIMMTTGHFSSYTFIVVDEVEEEKTNNGGKEHSGEVTCKTAKEWDKVADETVNYEDDDESVYCQKTGEEIVYCLSGVFTSSGVFSKEEAEIYSIRVDGKEFKCESEDHYADCFLGMEKYCEGLDDGDEYGDDGYYCHNEGVCKKTGETAKYCASTKGDGKIYYQAGDEKFGECTSENIEECYNEFHEYCGEIISGEEENSEIEEVPEECLYYMYCNGGGFDIYRCTPEDEDIYIYVNGNPQECADPEPEKERCDYELEMFSESCSYE